MTETFSNKDDNDKKSVVLIEYLKRCLGCGCNKNKERWLKKLIKN